MAQSLYTGWTGMATHQRALDNLGNNLANVNTVGFRGSDFRFSDLLVKNLTGGGFPEDGLRGATNPKTVGTGITTGGITTNFTQGPIEVTNNPLNVAIDGNGFFVVQTPLGTALTRNGAFTLDNQFAPGQRLLTIGDGSRVQGWMAQDGVIVRSADTVGDILLPAQGDLLAGERTTGLTLTGNLPSNISGTDFNGTTTTDLELKGNLTGNNSIRTKIYAPVTQSGGEDPISRQNQEIQVEITFTGPTLSADGSVNAYDWTMHTVDWPNPGDPPQQIYPTPAGTSADNQIRFFTESDPTLQRAAGQPVDERLSPGVSTVSTSWTDENGETVTTSFTVPANFRLDVSRMTELADAPGGNELETWGMNGNAAGTMTRTVEIFDEYTDFIRTTDENGNPMMEAVRRVQRRNNTIHFSRESLTDEGSQWSWQSSIGDQGGTLTFNTLGDMVESTGTSGALDYTFTGFRSINSTAALRVMDMDGYVDGVLQNISFDASGRIQGHYSNDEVVILGQLAMGDVPNPHGLIASSGALFYTSSSSGDIAYGVAGDTTAGGADGVEAIGAGELVPGALESSNVELTREFTTLISTQRGYQSNARIIQTTDEMLQQLVSMKR